MKGHPSALDVEALRADTPGCERLIHFDNAGAALQPSPVRRAVLDHLDLEQEIGGYAAEERAGPAVEGLYVGLARLLRCGADEIALAENATRAWDMIFYGLRFAPGDVILTSRAEYASNVLAFLQVRRRVGARVEFIPEADEGGVDLAALAERLDERVKLVAISHVPSQNGLVQPAAAVGRLTRAAGVPFLLDACQSAGQMALNVEDLGCDFLTGTGRKYLRGPRGTGFLFVRRDLLESLDPPFLDLRAAEWVGEREFVLRPDARRFESWESGVASRLGLAAAIDYANALDMAAVERRVGALAASLRRRLAAKARVRLHDHGERLCGIVAFTVEGVDSMALHHALAARAINTTVVTAPTARPDFEALGLAAVLRASVHYYNAEAEIDAFADAIDRCVA